MLQDNSLSIFSSNTGCICYYVIFVNYWAAIHSPLCQVLKISVKKVSQHKEQIGINITSSITKYLGPAKAWVCGEHRNQTEQ
jgi:hypothetical protein